MQSEKLRQQPKRAEVSTKNIQRHLTIGPHLYDTKAFDSVIAVCDIALKLHLRASKLFMLKLEIKQSNIAIAIFNIVPLS